MDFNGLVLFISKLNTYLLRKYVEAVLLEYFKIRLQKSSGEYILQGISLHCWKSDQFMEEMSSYFTGNYSHSSLCYLSKVKSSQFFKCNSLKHAAVPLWSDHFQHLASSLLSPLSSAAMTNS